MQQDIIETIAQHLAISPQDLELTSSLTDDLGLGPVEIADMIAVISHKYSVTFSPSDIEGLKTINDIVLTVEDLSLE